MIFQATIGNNFVLLIKKDDKKASSGLITKFTIKKFEFKCRFFRIEVLIYLESNSFQIEVQFITKLIYSQMMPNNKKIVFNESLFFCFDSEIP